MKKVLVLLSLCALLSGGFSGVHAQFQGCANEIGLEYGARYIAHSLNGFTLSVTAVGLNGFDPQLTILNAGGEAVACNEDSTDAAQVSLALPHVSASASPSSAHIDFPIPGDQGRFDYTIVVSSAEEQYGEFVLLLQGAEILPASEVDKFTIISNEGQVAQEVPLGIYVANLRRPQVEVYPYVTFTYGDEFSQTCSKSSSAVLCNGEGEDLSGSTVTLDGEQPIALNGDDAMLYYVLGEKPAEFSLEVGSYQKATFGPYTLIIYSGIGYPNKAQ